MKTSEMETPSAPRGQDGPESSEHRRAFVPPRLDRLGRWSALTLQQSIPVGPGNW